MPRGHDSRFDGHRRLQNWHEDGVGFDARATPAGDRWAANVSVQTDDDIHSGTRFDPIGTEYSFPKTYRTAKRATIAGAALALRALGETRGYTDTGMRPDNRPDERLILR